MTLSLEARPFPEVSIEAVQEINEMKIKLYSTIGNRPKKAAVEIPVMLERVEPEERLISAGDLQTLETWYNYFQSERSKNCCLQNLLTLFLEVFFVHQMSILQHFS